MQGRIQTIKKGGSVGIATSAYTNYISLFIFRYITCYTAPQNTTVTALLEYIE